MRTLVITLMIGAGLLAPVGSAVSAPTQASCKVPTDLTKLEMPLPRTAQRLLAREPLKIVAIGSSSTAGAGASSDSATYPSRLASELKTLFPDEAITVLNRGINGQDAQDMLARLKADVVEEAPDLVLWQLGTNAALRGSPIAEIREQVESGLAMLKQAGIDVILIDPQFVPAVITVPEADGMVEMISTSGRAHKVSVFHRFAIMRHWRQVSGLAFDTFTSADGLHMNDWSYGCWAKLLAGAVAQTIKRPVASASVNTIAPPTTARSPAQ
jgi:acyl-CoA thioesterase-1